MGARPRCRPLPSRFCPVLWRIHQVAIMLDDETVVVGLITSLVAAVVGRLSDAVTDWTEAIASTISFSCLRWAAALVCCSEWDHDVEARMALLEREEAAVIYTRGKGQYLIDDDTLGGVHRWEEIGKAYGWSFEKTLAVSCLRFMFWHLLQPVTFFVSFYFYFDALSKFQRQIASLVLVNEALYCLMTCLCVRLNPAFLLVNVKDSDFMSIMIYVFTPNIYVMSCVAGGWPRKILSEKNIQRDMVVGLSMLVMYTGDYVAIIGLLVDLCKIPDFALKSYHDLPIPIAVGCASSLTPTTPTAIVRLIIVSGFCLLLCRCHPRLRVFLYGAAVHLEKSRDSLIVGWMLLFLLHQRMASEPYLYMVLLRGHLPDVRCFIFDLRQIIPRCTRLERRGRQRKGSASETGGTGSTGRHQGCTREGTREG